MRDNRLSQFAHSENILSPSHGVDKSVALLMQILPHGASIFDIGAGEGRNSIPLAQAGYQVMVADKQLTKLRSEAILQNTRFQYHEGDITKYIFDQMYDAFVCMRVLHFLSPHDAYMLLESMKIHTYLGGCHALTFFLDETPHDEKYFFPSFEEITQIYSDWQLIEIWPKVISEPSLSTNGRPMTSISCLFQK